MYVAFDQLSNQARIWIYQASRPLTAEEQTALLQQAHAFLNEWASHGRPLHSSAAIRYDQFLILAVEESFQGATGCSIDASIQWIRAMEQALRVTLLDRTQVAFKQGDAIATVPMHQLQTQIQAGHIAPDMLTFDNTITQKGDLETRWLCPAQEAWFGTHFQPVSA